MPLLDFLQCGDISKKDAGSASADVWRNVYRIGQTILRAHKNSIT